MVAGILNKDTLLPVSLRTKTLLKYDSFLGGAFKAFEKYS